jgi:hypothetical protein
MNQYQFYTLFLVCLLRNNASTCFGRYSPIFGRLCTVAIWCNFMLTACRLRFLRTQLHQNSNCAEPPEDGRVTAETCKGIDS